MITLVWPSAPAVALLAGSIQVDGLPATMPIATPAEFTMVLTNNGQSYLAGGFQVYFEISAPGLTPDRLTVERAGNVAGTWGSALTSPDTGCCRPRLPDNSLWAASIAPGGSLTRRYRLTFLPGVPAGNAFVTATFNIVSAGVMTTVGTTPKHWITLTPQVSSPPPSGATQSARPGVSGAAAPGTARSSGATASAMVTGVDAAASTDPSVTGASGEDSPSGRAGASGRSGGGTVWLIITLVGCLLVVALLVFIWYRWRRSRLEYGT